MARAVKPTAHQNARSNPFASVVPAPARNTAPEQYRCRAGAMVRPARPVNGYRTPELGGNDDERICPLRAEAGLQGRQHRVQTLQLYV